MLATKRSARKDRELQKEANRREFSRQLNIVKQIGNLVAELLQSGYFGQRKDDVLAVTFQPPLSVGHWDAHVRLLSARLEVKLTITYHRMIRNGAVALISYFTYFSLL